MSDCQKDLERVVIVVTAPKVIGLEADGGAIEVVGRVAA
jgi:hypothetical protein